MKIAEIQITNFRGIKKAKFFLDGNTVLIGDNNSGKSTILEAIDLVLGPDRLSRVSIIDEHDFYGGAYLDDDHEHPKISVVLVIIGLSEEQTRRFSAHLEFWNQSSREFIDDPARTSDASVVPAIRVAFEGKYDVDDDDFIGETFFLHPQNQDGTYSSFKKEDKRKCGFLYLRTIRTGTRALSLERGSLLDMILKLQDKQLKMWENVLENLRGVPVAQDDELGINDTLQQVQSMMYELVPNEWADNPNIKVSNLTREDLRKTLSVFLSTGVQTSNGQTHSAPFQHQGTGTTNMLVLALLSMIADLKNSVIFAMEEPEIAIPPHTQKRLVERICQKSAQVIFTSHSPYILEEFPPKNLLRINRQDGMLTGKPCEYPPTVKPKTYREEMKRRFCEALLARRVLIAEGQTERDAWPAAAKRLHEINPSDYDTFSNLGIAIINAETDTQIAALSEFFNDLGIQVFAVYDKQTNPVNTAKINHANMIRYESSEKGFENVILNGTPEQTLRDYGQQLIDKDEWTPNLPSPDFAQSTFEDVKKKLLEFWKNKKGEGSIADCLGEYRTENEFPAFIRDTLKNIRSHVAQSGHVIAPVAPNEEQE